MQTILDITLHKGEKVYFASDFHLGAPTYQLSYQREVKIIKWLDSISSDAKAIFLLGDIFDCWIEYKYLVPKGYIRFLGKLAQLRDKGVLIYFTPGNHDYWMNNYFSEELSIPMIYKPSSFFINNLKFHIGHGDGLGPNDFLYKIIKKILTNKTNIWLFKSIFHPDFALYFGQFWSKWSRKGNKEIKIITDISKEWLYQYCKDLEAKNHHDVYVFGHRHVPMDQSINQSSRYINLGEWINYSYFLSVDLEKIKFSQFELK